jgi:ATP-dependent phosphofructokinase / diphosphate-dependent phosphofructokinase
MEGQKSKMVFDDSLQFLEPADYEAAKKYVPDPENYDFRKILNW